MLLLIMAVLAICIAGCGLAEAQAERDTATSLAKSVALKILDKAKIDQSMMTADGTINDPEYTFDFTAGAGIMCSGRVKMNGVQVRGSLNAAGVGSEDSSDAFLDRVNTILTMRSIAVEKRKDLAMDVFASWFDKRDQTIATQPAKELSP
jgi:hypothetical protein